SSFELPLFSRTKSTALRGVRFRGSVAQAQLLSARTNPAAARAGCPPLAVHRGARGAWASDPHGSWWSIRTHHRSTPARCRAPGLGLQKRVLLRHRGTPTDFGYRDPQPLLGGRPSSLESLRRGLIFGAHTSRARLHHVVLRSDTDGDTQSR